LPHDEQVGAAAAQVEQLVAQQDVWQQRRWWRWQQAEETLGNEAARAAKANTAILTSFMTNPPLTIGTTKTLIPARSKERERERTKTLPPAVRRPIG
jgi:hypothetical protein